MRLVKLWCGGKPIYVNPDNVNVVFTRVDTGHTGIEMAGHFSEDDFWTVEETMAEVVKKLAARAEEGGGDE